MVHYTQKIAESSLFLSVIIAVSDRTISLQFIKPGIFYTAYILIVGKCFNHVETKMMIFKLYSFKPLRLYSGFETLFVKKFKIQYPEYKALAVLSLVVLR